MFDRGGLFIELDIVYEHDIFTKTTRLTFVERLANYTITVHADISQPETYLNCIIIVLFFRFFQLRNPECRNKRVWTVDGWMGASTNDAFNAFNARPRCRAVNDVTGGCQTTKQEERGEHCARSFRESLSVSVPGKHGEAEPGPEQRLSRAATV